MINNLKSATFNKLETDVAIIGSGISGLYSGWRLLTGTSNESGKKPSVSIFEMSDRIGGRLFSVKNYPKMGNVIGELGGMRYMEHQEIISTLISKVFKLKSIPFPMGDPSKNIMYLRGQRFNEKMFGKIGFKTNYNLAEKLQGQHPDEIFIDIINNVLKNNKQKIGIRSRKEWDEIKDILLYYKGPDKGEKLRDIGFWNLINSEIGNEGYNYISDAGAYFSNTINWNAAEAMPYIIGDFIGDIEYKTIEGGFDSIAEELAKAFIKKNGGLYNNSQLINFEHSTDHKFKYKLIIRNTLTDIDNYVFCNSIILAMPRRSLELINQNNFLFDNGLNKEFIHNVRSVIGEPSFKLLMGFETEDDGTPWWKKFLDIDNGRSITDLPMRQCYYFGTDTTDSKDKERKASLLLASYNDMRTVDFWKPLEIADSGKANFKNLLSMKDAVKSESFIPKETSFFSKVDISNIQKKYKQAPKRMVLHSLEQLKELHDLDKIPEPFTTIYENWNDDPFGGGYHAWKARYNVGDVMKYMRRPIIGEALHICGEAYSDQQGWVEGALCVAELMLQKEFNLNKPSDWLDDNYYLGR